MGLISLIPPDVRSDVLVPAVRVGGIVGAVGGTLAGALGIVRGVRQPGIRAVAGGISYFMWGTILWGCRIQYLRRLDHEPVRRDRIIATTGAGAVAGVCAGTFATVFGRQRGAIIPSILTWTIVSFSAQEVYETFGHHNPVPVPVPSGALISSSEAQQRQQQQEEKTQGEKGGNQHPNDNIFQRIARSRWSPISVLSDEEYLRIMENRLLAVDADIALLDEQVEQLKKEVEQDGPKGADDVRGISDGGA